VSTGVHRRLKGTARVIDASEPILSTREGEDWTVGADTGEQRRTWVHPKQQPDGRYRGRRRLPKLPSRRYAAVVFTAIVGAVAVALGAGAVLPDSSSHANANDGSTQALSVQDRLSALDKVNRSKDRTPVLRADQGAPDVWLLPVRVEYQITTLFEVRWGVFHSGVDLAAPYGTPYFAAHAGTVVLAAYDGGYGNCIKIDHGNGIETVYGHASKLLVTEGEHVNAGDELGLIGSTGFSTGNHLHFEVRIDDVAKDPLPFMLAHGVDIARRAEIANGGTVVS
jgi:murein DD-endopeptidase MepM/ murein hydrolase activator NlpD